MADEYYPLTLVNQYFTSNVSAAFPYLESRGISSESARHFQLGFAPHDSQGFFAWMREHNLDDATLIECGVLNQYKKPMFHNRVTLPMIEAGEVRGIIARACSGAARYLNTKQIGVFFGFDFVDLDKPVILVEGAFDTIMMHQNGYTNTLGCCGLPRHNQIQKLIQLGVKHIKLMLDNDEDGEGRNATIRILEEQYPIQISIIEYVGKDPGSLQEITREHRGKFYLEADQQRETDPRRLLERLLRSELKKIKKQ